MKYRVSYTMPAWKGAEVFYGRWWTNLRDAEIDEFDIRREGIYTTIEHQPDDYEDPVPSAQQQQPVVLSEPPPGYGD